MSEIPSQILERAFASHELSFEISFSDDECRQIAQAAGMSDADEISGSDLLDIFETFSNICIGNTLLGDNGWEADVNSERIRFVCIHKNICDILENNPSALQESPLVENLNQDLAYFEKEKKDKIECMAEIIKDIGEDENRPCF